MFPVKIIRRLGRKAATRVADKISRNELFEQHGERSRQPPLQPITAPEAEPATVPPAGPSGSVPSGSVPSGSALSGSVPMDADEVKVLLGPSQRVRIVNHWATWCDPCIEELPLLIALHARLGEAVELVGVSWDLFEGGETLPTAMKVAAFSEEHGLTWGSALVTTPPESFFAALDIDWKRIPQTWIIEPDGAIRRRIEGVLDAESVEALVAELTG